MRTNPPRLFEQARAVDADETALATLAEIAGRHRLGDIEARCRTALGQAADELLTVAVLGRFKAGKTTMLNQLLGEDLLPVEAIPATAVITRLRYGPTVRADVKLRHRPAVPVEPEHLADWTTETGNPGNTREVEWVRVESPALADLDELVLVDTPGTGSSWGHNTETSLGWLPNVGAAIVAVNATQPLSEDDLDLIERVRPHTPTLLVVLTKIDLLTEHDLQAVTQHVRRQLRDRLDAAPPVLTFSIAARHRPQREKLRQVLQQLNRSHTTAVVALAGHRVRQLASECRAYLELARAAATSRDEAVEDLRRALAAEVDRLPVLRQQVRAQLVPVGQEMTAHTQTRVRRALPATTSLVMGDLTAELPRWRGTLAAESSRFRGWLRDELVAVVSPFAAGCADDLEVFADQGVASIQRMGEAFVQRIGQLVLAATGVELDLPVPQPSRAPIEAVDPAVDAVFDSHLELLSWAIPMVVARPAVHRHFLRMVPWQVEKNLTRTAYRTATAAKESIERSLGDYVGVLADVLDACRHLAAAQPDDEPAISEDLRALDALGERNVIAEAVG